MVEQTSGVQRKLLENGIICYLFPNLTRATFDPFIRELYERNGTFEAGSRVLLNLRAAEMPNQAYLLLSKKLPMSIKFFAWR